MTPLRVRVQGVVLVVPRMYLRTGILGSFRSRSLIPRGTRHLGTEVVGTSLFTVPPRAK